MTKRFCDYCKGEINDHFHAIQISGAEREPRIYPHFPRSEVCEECVVALREWIKARNKEAMRSKLLTPKSRLS